MTDVSRGPEALKRAVIYLRVSTLGQAETSNTYALCRPIVSLQRRGFFDAVAMERLGADSRRTPAVVEVR